MAINRRHFIGLLGTTVGAVTLGIARSKEIPYFSLMEPALAAEAKAISQTKQTTGTSFSLPPLPYDYAALEPYIDRETMQFHHDRHHAAYVRNLNAAVDKHPEFKSLSAAQLIQQLDNLPEDIRTTVRNNGGGHLNHSMFWEIMSPNGGGAPTGAIATAINQAFGNFDAFKQAFNNAGKKRFGSGWAWLVLDSNNQLQVISTSNQDSPLMQGMFPIMGNDVWEHAYYLTYRNRRGDYLEAWWNVVNWDEVNRRYAQALG